MCNECFCLDTGARFGDTCSMSKNIFFIGLIIAASGLISPPVALAVGLVYGFSFLHPFHIEARKLSKLLLQTSVVGLGFGMDLQQVMQAGRSGFIYTAGSISFALLLGWGLGKLFRVKQRISILSRPARPFAREALLQQLPPSPMRAKKRLPSRSELFLC